MQKKIAFVAMALGIMVVAAVLIALKFQGIDEKKAEAKAEAESKAEISETPKFPRWVFNDSSIPEEAAYKAETLAKIDTFWREFKKSKDKLNPKTNSDHLGEFAPAFMDKYVHCVYPGIMWEIKGDPINKEITNFTLSSESTAPLQPVIDTFIERAPKLAGWRFNKFKPAFAPDEIVDGMQTFNKSKLTTYEAKCELSPTNRIDVTIFSPDFANSENDTVDGYRICHLALGEENAQRWAGKFKMVHRTVKKDVPTATRELVKDFNALKQTVLDRLPKVPYHNFNWQERSKYFYVVRDEKNKKEMELTKNAPNINECIDDFPFYSYRYSKTSEKFCLLISSADNKIKDQSEFDQFLDEIDNEMKKNHCGGTWGHKNEITPQGVNGFDVNLFVNDIPKCVSVLNKIIERRGLSHDSLIIFHDADLSFEWIGLFDDTTPPLFSKGDQ